MSATFCCGNRNIRKHGGCYALYNSVSLHIITWSIVSLYTHKILFVLQEVDSNYAIVLQLRPYFTIKRECKNTAVKSF